MGSGDNRGIVGPSERGKLINRFGLRREFCAGGDLWVERHDFGNGSELCECLDSLGANQAGSNHEDLHRSIRLSLSASARIELGDSSQRHSATGFEKGTTLRTSPPAARTAASMAVSLAPGAMMLTSIGTLAASSSIAMVSHMRTAAAFEVPYGKNCG